MMGRRNGVLKLLKDDNPDMMVVHCVIHRENLAAQGLSPELNQIMKNVIKAVNFIKAHPKVFQKNSKYFVRTYRRIMFDFFSTLMSDGSQRVNVLSVLSHCTRQFWTC